MTYQNKGDSFKRIFANLTTRKSIFFIVIIGFAVYFNTIFNGFVGDDWGQIIDNVTIHSLKNIFNLFTGSTFYVHGAGSFGLYYKPIMMVMYSLLYSVFGSQAIGYHLIQLMFHIANSCLLLLFYNKYFTKKSSFFLALLFLIHPINSESVLYIANLQEVLFFFFGSISLLILQNYFNRKSLILIGMFGLFSLLSKETGLLFVIILLLYSYLFKNNKFHYLTAGITLAVYSLLRISTMGIRFEHPDTYLISNGNFIERLFTIPKILFYYLYTFFFPRDLAIAQHWIVKDPAFGNFYGPLIIDIIFFLIAASFAYYLYLKGNKLFKKYLFFLVWFILGLGFHIQLIALDATVSDRWLYFPMVGLLGMLGVVVGYFWSMIEKYKLAKTLSVLFIFITLILSCRSIIRTYDWRNDFVLCSHDAKVNRNSYVLELCLGNEYRKINEYNLAISHLNNSIILFPKYYISMYYLAMTYENQNNFLKALEYYRRTVANNTWGYGADSLATLLVYHGEPGQAKEIADENLKKQPGNAQLWYALSLAEYKLGNKDQAITAAKNAYKLAPNNLTKKVLEGFQNNLPLKFDNK